MAKYLIALMSSLKFKFTLYGKVISYDEIFSDTGLFPAIVQRADNLCSLCFGYGIGATFTEIEKSVLGIKVQFDDVTPNSLRLIYIYDVMLEIANAIPGQEKIPLDELLYD